MKMANIGWILFLIAQRPDASFSVKCHVSSEQAAVLHLDWAAHGHITPLLGLDRGVKRHQIPLA